MLYIKNIHGGENMKKNIILIALLLIISIGLSSCTKADKNTSENNKTINRNITLFFRDNNLGLVKEKRSIEINSNEQLEKRVIEELIKGPKTKELYSTIPKETKLNGIEIIGSKAIVDLSEEFITKHSGGSEAEYLTVYSVVDTLTELLNINKVEFLIDGEKRKLFNHMELYGTFQRDESVMKK
jgi:germination protein M